MPSPRSASTGCPTTSGRRPSPRTASAPSPTSSSPSGSSTSGTARRSPPTRRPRRWPRRQHDVVTATHLADLDGLRDLAVGVAYRMVGSRTEAEDLAQEVLVRVEAAAGEQGLDNPEAFVTTVTTRLAIDHLRSARVRRERYVGPWLPEPVATDPLADPSAGAALADSLSFAVLV